MTSTSNRASYDEIATFMGTFGEAPYKASKNDKNYYKWKIQENPYKKGYIFLERRNVVIAGSTTLTPKKISTFGKVVLAAEIGDTFTNPAYRRQGIFSKGVRESTNYAISNGVEIIYGTPNKFSLRGYQEKLSYPPYPFGKIIQLSKHFFSINQIPNYFRRQEGSRGQEIVKLFKSICTQIISLKLKDPEAENSIKIQVATKFEKEFDGLWGTPRTDFGFFTVRDKTYLNWRFFLNPDIYQVYCASRNDGLLGYIVTKISQIGIFKVGTICDFIAFGDSPGIFQQLLNHAERMLKIEGVRFARLWCAENSPYFPELVRSGYNIDLRRPVIIYSETSIGKKILETESKWHFTLADCDNI